MGGRAGGPRGGPGRGGGSEPQTATERGWKGLNLSDTRLTIDDDELAFLENGMWLGRSIQAVPLYNGPPGAALNASPIKESLGTSLTYGIFTTPHPVTIAVFEDGSAYMRDHFLDNAVDKQIAGPGTFSSSPGETSISIWQDGPVLFMDDKAGYAKWDGTTYTVIDATKTGHALAVFSGYVFLSTAPRALTNTAPNTFSDFAAGDGAGVFKITDDAFIGAIVALLSTVSQLWIDGSSAIDALGNIATASGVTTFSVTNAVSTVGSSFGDSLIGYFRSLVFATGYSISSLLGVTPQKLSGKIDRLFPLLSPAITFGPTSGVCQLNGQIVLVFIFQYTDPVTNAVRSELLCFQEGKWFLMRTPDLGGARILDIVTLTVGKFPELYGIDSFGRIYRIFARATDAQQGTMTVSGKLFDLGDPVEGHQGLKIGFDFSAPSRTSVVPVTVNFTTEAATIAVTTIEKFLPAVDSPLGSRYALYRRDAPPIGQRLGWTIQLPCASGICLEAAHLQHAPTGGWEPVDPGTTKVLFINNAGQHVHFTNSAAQAVAWLN